MLTTNARPDEAAYVTVRIDRPCCLCARGAGGSCSHCDDTRLVTVDVACHELTTREQDAIVLRGSPADREAVLAYWELLEAEDAHEAAAAAERRAA